jgi:hypothetical protein
VAEVRRQPGQAAPARAAAGGSQRLAGGTSDLAGWKATGPVHRRASVKLDGSGNGSVSFDVWSANHLWAISSVIVNVSAATPGVFPQVTLHIGGQAVPGLSAGASWTGNQETFQGRLEIGAGDSLSVDFVSGAAGAIATAIIDGESFLWR